MDWSIVLKNAQDRQARNILGLKAFKLKAHRQMKLKQSFIRKRPQVIMGKVVIHEPSQFNSFINHNNEYVFV